MNSQTGISIVAIIVATVAIGVVMSSTSTLDHKISDIQSSLEYIKIQQEKFDVSRPGVDQQGFNHTGIEREQKIIQSTTNKMLVESISTLPLTKFYEPQFALRVQGMSEVIDVLLIADLDIPLSNQDKQSFLKIQKKIMTGKMTPTLFDSIKSVIKNISNENDLKYDCQDLSGNLAEFSSDTAVAHADDSCPSGTTMCPRYGDGKCCDGCLKGTCLD